MELLAFRGICCIYVFYSSRLPQPQICNNSCSRWMIKFSKINTFSGSNFEITISQAGTMKSRRSGRQSRRDAVRPELISDKALRKLVKTSFPVVSVTWREVTLSDVGFVGGGVEGKLSYTQTGVDYPVSDFRSRNRDVAKRRRLSCRPPECHKVDEWLHINTPYLLYIILFF